MKSMVGVKIILALLVILALCAVSPLTARAAEPEYERPADNLDALPPEVLTATVTLLGFDERDGRTYMTVQLPQSSVEVSVSSACSFISEGGGSLSPADFAAAYTGKVITMDFNDLGEFFLVLECRGGSE